MTGRSPNSHSENRPAAAERLTRRGFLGRTFSTGSALVLRSGLTRVGLPAVGATSAFLAACSTEPVAPTVVTLFSTDRVLAAARPQRIPFAIVTPDATGDADNVALPADDGTVEVTIRLDGSVILETEVKGRVVDHDHVGDADPDHQHANLFRYYPLRATLPEPGIYDLTLGIEGATTDLIVQIFDPSEIQIPIVGDRLEVPPTPTIDDPRGVDRICTRFEPCPFHEISANEVRAAGCPMALLVATPAFCSTAYCGPVVETLIKGSTDAPDVEFIHVEVYENPDEVNGNFLDPRIRIAPAVLALGLEFEPSLFLVAADGTLVDRIDNVFDETELAEALRSLTA